MEQTGRPPVSPSRLEPISFTRGISTFTGRCLVQRPVFFVPERPIFPDWHDSQIALTGDMRFDAAFRESFATLVGWRRDVRRFRRDPVPESDMMELLALAQQAPSVGNSQPWRFVRVRSASLRETLAVHADAAAVEAGARIADDDRRGHYARLKLHGLREAPEIIAIFCDEGTAAGHGLGAATMPEARAYSVVLAIHTLWLAARARGIALGWVSIVEPDFVGRQLDVPEDWRLIALLCLGWPEEETDVPELERLGWQERLDWRDHISER